jgi:hypothetical protein
MIIFSPTEIAEIVAITRIWTLEHEGVMPVFFVSGENF